MWEQAHIVKYEHPLATNEEAMRVLNLGPFSCPGGGGAVNNRRPSETATGFRNTSGVSYRLFVDFAEPAMAWGATSNGTVGATREPTLRRPRRRNTDRGVPSAFDGHP